VRVSDGKPLRVGDAIARITTWVIETDTKGRWFGRKPIPDDVVEDALFLRIQATAAKRERVVTSSRHESSRAVSSGGLLTTMRVAEVAGVSLQTVQRACRSGEIPAQRFGRDYLIDSADAARWITGRKHR
jgi:excisionase family DNA binding protein